MKRRVLSVLLVLMLVMSSVGGAFASVVPDTVIVVSPEVAEACPHVADIPDSMTASVSYTDADGNVSTVAEGIEVAQVYVEEESIGVWLGADDNPINTEILDEILEEQEAAELEEFIAELDMDTIIESLFGMTDEDFEAALEEINKIMDRYTVTIDGVPEHFNVESGGIAVTSELVAEIRGFVVRLFNDLMDMDLDEDATISEILNAEVDGYTLYDELSYELTDEELAELEGFIESADRILEFMTSDEYEGTVLAAATLTCSCYDVYVMHDYYVITEDGEEVNIGYVEEYVLGEAGGVISADDIEKKPVYGENTYEFEGAYDYWTEELQDEFVLDDEFGGIWMVYYLDEEDFIGDLSDYIYEDEWDDDWNEYTIVHEYWAEVDGEMVYVDSLYITRDSFDGEVVYADEIDLIEKHKGVQYQADGFFGKSVGYPSMEVEDLDVDGPYDYIWDNRMWDEFETDEIVVGADEEFEDGFLVRYVTDEEADTSELEVAFDDASLYYSISHEFWIDVDGEMILLDTAYNDEYAFEGDVIKVSEDEYILEYMGYIFEVKGTYDEELTYFDWDERDFDLYEMESLTISEDMYTTGLVIVYEAVGMADDGMDDGQDDSDLDDNDQDGQEGQNEGSEEDQNLEEDEDESDVPLTGDDFNKYVMLALLALGVLLTLKCAVKNEDC